MKRLAIAALALIGIAAIGNGAWIYAKARLAQVLLRASWERTLHVARDARPWPWADTHAVARLVVERTGSDFVVLEGSNGRALAFAPGHLEHTPLPGESGNAVITAHRDTHFAVLRDLRDGDVLRVQRRDGAWRTYRVAARRTLDQSDVWITRQSDETTLTLVTCYPFDALVPGGRGRYAVIAVVQRSEV